jgi:dUTP pyrophosphatase
MAAVLSGDEIRGLIERDPPLVEGLIDIYQQVQPNGLDLTLREIALLQSSGQITVKNSERQLPGLSPLVFDGLGFIDLVAGIYLITYNEIVHLPGNVMALARPRSSLLRCGVTVGTAVWDAGYCGRSQSLMVVYNSHGLRLQKNARIVQLIFMWLSYGTEVYRGIYQNENI